MSRNGQCRWKLSPAPTFCRPRSCVVDRRTAMQSPLELLAVFAKIMSEPGQFPLLRSAKPCSELLAKRRRSAQMLQYRLFPSILGPMGKIHRDHLLRVFVYKNHYTRFLRPVHRHRLLLCPFWDTISLC